MPDPTSLANPPLFPNPGVLALQEKATHLYYRALARDIDEPLLKGILGEWVPTKPAMALFSTIC